MTDINDCPIGILSEYNYICSYGTCKTCLISRIKSLEAKNLELVLEIERVNHWCDVFINSSECMEAQRDNLRAEIYGDIYYPRNLEHEDFVKIAKALHNKE